MVVIKYLASRDTPAERKSFREVCKRLQEASPYVRKALFNAKGQLNPGMMPRSIDDLAFFAPPCDTLDAHHVSLWNRVAEVWRQKDDLRKAVLRYAMRSDELNSVSSELWPEVVYSLIERAHWHAIFGLFTKRSGITWPASCFTYPCPACDLTGSWSSSSRWRSPTSSNKTFRHSQTLPSSTRKQNSPRARAARGRLRSTSVARSLRTRRATKKLSAQRRPFYFGSRIPREELPDDDDTPCVRPKTPLSSAEPIVFSQNVLHNLRESALEAAGEGQAGQARSPDHPRRFVRARLCSRPPAGGSGRPCGFGLARNAAGKADRGLHPSSHRRPARLANRDRHLDLRRRQHGRRPPRFPVQGAAPTILWHAPDAHHFNFDYAEELKHRLSTLNLEVPDKLDLTLSKK